MSVSFTRGILWDPDVWPLSRKSRQDMDLIIISSNICSVWYPARFIVIFLFFLSFFLLRVFEQISPPLYFSSLPLWMSNEKSWAGRTCRRQQCCPWNAIRRFPRRKTTVDVITKCSIVKARSRCILSGSDRPFLITWQLRSSSESKTDWPSKADSIECKGGRFKGDSRGCDDDAASTVEKKRSVWKSVGATSGSGKMAKPIVGSGSFCVYSRRRRRLSVYDSAR